MQPSLDKGSHFTVLNDTPTTIFNSHTVLRDFISRHFDLLVPYDSVLGG